MSKRIIWVLLGLCWCATLPWRAVLDPDEGRYALIPLEMLISGDWLTPRLNNLLYFEKPPLQYWGTAVLYFIFGISEWTSRLWAAGLAFLCLPLCYVFVKYLNWGEQTAWRAALLLAINPFFVLIGQINLLDQCFTFIICAALFSFLRAQSVSTGSTLERNAMILMWVFLALGVLSKGLIALVLPSATLAVYMLLERDISPLKRLYFFPGLPVFLLITLPWFVLMQAHHPDFIQFFFIHEHFARFLTQVHKRSGPIWYFFPVLLLAFLPVITYTQRALCDPYNRNVSSVCAKFNADRFMLIWCGVTVLFFSVSQSKLPPYILPVMPPMAVLFARVMDDSERTLSRSRNILAWLIVLLGSCLIFYDFTKQGEISPTMLTLVMSAFLLVAVMWLLPLWARRIQLTLVSAWLPLAFCSVLGMQFLLAAYGEMHPLRSARALVAQIKPLLNPSTTVYSVQQFRHSAVFYLGRPVYLVDYRGELDFGLQHAKMKYIPTLASFVRTWESTSDAAAFMSPETYESLLAQGFKGRIVAADGRSVVVSRL